MLCIHTGSLQAFCKLATCTADCFRSRNEKALGGLLQPCSVLSLFYFEGDGCVLVPAKPRMPPLGALLGYFFLWTQSRRSVASELEEQQRRHRAGELPAATSCHRRQERSRFVFSGEEELILQVTAAEKILLEDRDLQDAQHIQWAELGCPRPQNLVFSSHLGSHSRL